MPQLAATFVLILECALVTGGLVLLWRFGLSAPARQAPRRLQPWAIPPSTFFLFLWLVICGGLIAPYISNFWLKHLAIDEDFRLILGTAIFHLGMLAGIALFRAAFAPRPTTVTAAPVAPHPVLAGVVVFLISMPVVVAVSLLWLGLLKACHIPTPQQDAIDILRHAGADLPIAILLLSAIVIAPINEELIFRAGIFRYVRTRLPRWAALLLPACIFGAMHANVASFAPLVALGVVFSLAYERTGRISTTIIAHALFNLTSAALVMAGVDV